MGLGGTDPPDRVLRSLVSNPDKVFTESERRDAVDVKAGGIGVILSRLEDFDLGRHNGNYWEFGEDGDVAAYTSMLKGTRVANELSVKRIMWSGWNTQSTTRIADEFSAR